MKVGIASSNRGNPDVFLYSFVNQMIKQLKNILFFKKSMFFSCNLLRLSIIMCFFKSM